MSLIATYKRKKNSNKGKADKNANKNQSSNNESVTNDVNQNDTKPLKSRTSSGRFSRRSSNSSSSNITNNNSNQQNQSDSNETVQPYNIADLRITDMNVEFKTDALFESLPLEERLKIRKEMMTDMSTANKNNLPGSSKGNTGTHTPEDNSSTAPVTPPKSGLNAPNSKGGDLPPLALAPSTPEPSDGRKRGRSLATWLSFKKKTPSQPKDKAKDKDVKEDDNSKPVLAAEEGTGSTSSASNSPRHSPKGTPERRFLTFKTLSVPPLSLKGNDEGDSAATPNGIMDVLHDGSAQHNSQGGLNKDDLDVASQVTKATDNLPGNHVEDNANDKVELDIEKEREQEKEKESSLPVVVKDEKQEWEETELARRQSIFADRAHAIRLVSQKHRVVVQKHKKDWDLQKLRFDALCDRVQNGKKTCDDYLQQFTRTTTMLSRIGEGLAEVDPCGIGETGTLLAAFSAQGILRKTYGEYILEMNTRVKIPAFFLSHIFLFSISFYLTIMISVGVWRCYEAVLQPQQVPADSVH